MRDACRKVEHVGATDDLMCIACDDVYFALNALQRNRSIDRVFCHVFADRKKDPHYFKVLVLEKRDG
ncbi:MAG: hypothetical protein JWR21_1410 [Herminiimonas sp.]|nr:hypothetical protein [Herminiimonas sp.]MDB5852547.1 hypothetical protein [Herminiimonas sp.]